MERSEALSKASEAWDKAPPQDRRRWWLWPEFIRYQNEMVCGVPILPWGAGIRKRIKELCPGRKFDNAISIGCGLGKKEKMFLRDGLVAHFDLFEISGERIARGKVEYEKEGLGSSATWTNGDGMLALEESEKYDLVHWDGSLHHMLDAGEAVRASRNALKPGGLFVLNDYVGPTRMRWNERELRFARNVRAALPDRYFVHYMNPKWRMPRDPADIPIEKNIAGDPTEAADSSAIMPNVRKQFPEVYIWMLGGVVYHFALMDILQNFDPEKDVELLRALMLLDRALSELGENHFASCLAIKK